jgi:hypothetical protein
VRHRGRFPRVWQFIKHAGCASPLPRKGGLPRCCHCGGTLYLAPMEGSLPVVDSRLRDRMLVRLRRRSEPAFLMSKMSQNVPLFGYPLGGSKLPNWLPKTG